MLEFPLNQLQTYYGYLCDLCPLTAFIFSDLNYKIVIFLSQTESAPKHFFRKKALHEPSYFICLEKRAVRVTAGDSNLNVYVHCKIGIILYSTKNARMLMDT
jgi:hypothetical protein